MLMSDLTHISCAQKAHLNMYIKNALYKFITIHYSNFASQQVCLLLFTEQPTITVQPQSLEKTEGDNVTLSCNADGNPIPTISWTINGSLTAIKGNSRISFTKNKQQLTIRNVKRTDSGTYRCVASNKFGNASSDAALLDIQCNVNLIFIQ